jgi:hypothetical protein
MQREMWWVCCQCKMKFNEHEDPNKCVYESESLRPLQNKVSNWTPHSSCYRSKESNRCCLSTVDFPFDVLHVETKFFAKDIREQHGSIRFAQTCPGDVRLRILVCVLQLWSEFGVTTKWCLSNGKVTSLQLSSRRTQLCNFFPSILSSKHEPQDQ